MVICRRDSHLSSPVSESTVVGPSMRMLDDINSRHRAMATEISLEEAMERSTEESTTTISTVAATTSTEAALTGKKQQSMG
ncbi:hypothetical protein PIB30_072680 [Stylosanthes scabra]|uniref:Uncharacterized protein n=1 Tax=Stylosanthes scabra TaxID=79078 RepID=A0ABU6WP18_9FABA|nr:hypothetical protein [Stylosanthes scabra]